MISWPSSTLNSISAQSATDYELIVMEAMAGMKNRDEANASEMPLFSVIIPTFNRAELLGGTVKSVFAQGCTDFEIIVVDDGSTDGTMDYLQSLEEYVRVFQQPNRGAGAARNLGVRHAKGKYLAFLDSDDLWFPWSLEVYRDVIRDHCDPSFIAGKPQVFTDHREVDKVVCGPTRTEWFADYLASGHEWRWWGASSFVIRRDAFEAVGGFTEEQGINDEDTDLTLRMGIAHGFVQIKAPVTFAFREHAASVSKNHKRLLRGTWSRVRAERGGQYPGGRARARERRRIITRHIRPVTLGCLQRGLWREAWTFYVATFGWNASLGRVKYLTAFPLLALMSCLTAARSADVAGTRWVGNNQNRQVRDGR
jgi:GT2 family glycosyltransferase